MDRRDLDRQISEAFDDLILTAPRPPRLDSIRSGYAPLQRLKRPPSVRSGRLAVATAAAAAVVVVGVGVLFGSVLDGSEPQTLFPPAVDQTTTAPAPVDQTIESLYGLWVLDEYTTAGVTFNAPFASDRPSPWIEFTPDAVSGHSGCNSFGGAAASVVGGRLAFDGVMTTDVACAEPNPEPIVTLMTGARPPGISVSITATAFTVTAAETTLVFTRADTQPVVAQGEWSVNSADLVCTGGIALNHQLTDPSATVSEMLLAVAGVESLDERSEFEYSYGFDDQGSAIAAVIAGDVEPRQFHRRSCATAWGIRPNADLGGAVLTWVNLLGLNRQDTETWSNRFVELCAGDTDTAQRVAAAHLDEDSDLSIRSGGSLPTADEVAGALEIIRLSTCAASGPPVDGDSSFSLVDAQAMALTDAPASSEYAGDDLTGTWTDPLTNGKVVQVSDIDELQRIALKAAAVQALQIATDQDSDLRMVPPYRFHPMFRVDDETYATAVDAANTAVNFAVDADGNVGSVTSGNPAAHLYSTEPASSAAPYETVWVGLPPSVSVVRLTNRRTGAEYLQTPIAGSVYFEVPGQDSAGKWNLHGLTVGGILAEADGLTIGWRDGCSASNSDIVPETQDGLPPAVQTTRLRLMQAALTCDYQAIVDLVPDPANDSYWWQPGLDAERLEDLDLADNTLLELVTMLQAPYGVSDDGGHYAWPILVQQDRSEMQSSDIDRVAELLGITGDELIERIDAFPGYALFRVTIQDDGTWTGALAGD